MGENCHAEASFSRDNGRNWQQVEKYVRNCAWARDADLKIDSTQILCESYKKKEGSQRFFQNDNPLELVSGTNYFRKKTKLFDHVVGFAKFSEYLVVAEVSMLFALPSITDSPPVCSICLRNNLSISRYLWTGAPSLRANSLKACILKLTQVLILSAIRK